MKTYKSAVAILSRAAKTFSADYAHGQAHTLDREAWNDMCDTLDRKGIEYSTTNHLNFGETEEERTFNIQIDQVAHA